MAIVEEINYVKLNEFENQISGNVKVGGYNMNDISPIKEGRCYKIKFEEKDINRLFLLGEVTFKDLTSEKNFKLSGLLDTVINIERVKYWIDAKLDLRISTKWSPVFVSPHIDGPFVTIDGNHRLMAHYNQHKTIERLNGYLFVHPNIQNWGFIPIEARK